MTSQANFVENVFFNNVRVMDPAAGIDGQFAVGIDQGKLSYFAEVTAANAAAILAANASAKKSQAKVCDAQGLWLCPAFTDLAFQLTEPGFRYKAPLSNELAAAASAGFSQVVGWPMTQPINDAPAVTALLLSLSAQIDRAQILPLGALTEQLAGERLTSLRALQQAGCIGVTQDQSPIANPVIVLNAYRYAKTFELMVFSCPEEAYFSRLGCVHEGVMAARLGLPAIPAVAETLAVARDIALVKATGVRLHFSRISCAQSLALIADAKAQQLPITCDVAITHLCYDETAIENFNSLFHLRPPLRSAVDRKALIAAVASGVIDAICTAHQPHEPAAKLAPFAETAAGMATLDTFIPQWLALQHQGISISRLVDAVANQPQQILRHPPHALRLSDPINLTLINPNCQWQYETATAQSAALNNPRVGEQLTGKVLATWREGKEIYRDQLL
jgi:dihydroorotase